MMRSELDAYGKFDKYLDENTKKTFIAEINKTVNWIEELGDTLASRDDYKNKFDDFKKIGEPIKARHWYYGELDQYFG